MFSLLSGTALMFPRLTIASGLPALTHTYTPEPKPAFQFEQPDKAFKTAGVCFLGVGDCGGAAGYDSSSSGAGSANDDFYIDTSNQCLNEGFVRQNCNSVQTIDGVCPYNSAYGLGCKCLPDLISCPAGQVGVGESCDEMYASCECDPALVSCSAKENGTGASCGGRYESCVCKPEYQYTSSNCSYPRSVSGDSCGGQYTDCVCPAGVDEGPYGCAEYYPSPCSSVCKVAYSDNCHIRESVNVPYYCEKYWDDCPSKCEVAAADNCINRTAVSTPYGCESYYTAGTGTTTAVLMAASPIGATVLPSARPAMPTTAGTKRRFRCRPMLTARPTTPTAPPNVPPGAVTQGTLNPGQAV